MTFSSKSSSLLQKSSSHLPPPARPSSTLDRGQAGRTGPTTPKARTLVQSADNFLTAPYENQKQPRLAAANQYPFLLSQPQTSTKYPRPLSPRLSARETPGEGCDRVSTSLRYTVQCFSLTWNPVPVCNSAAAAFQTPCLRVRLTLPPRKSR